MLIVRSIEDKTMYGMQELYLCMFSDIFTSSTVAAHSSTNYQLIFFCTYNFHSLNTHQHHTIYHIHTHDY